MRDLGLWICFALGDQPSKRFYFLRCILNDESHSGNHRLSQFPRFQTFFWTSQRILDRKLFWGFFGKFIFDSNNFIRICNWFLDLKNFLERIEKYD